MAELTEEQKIIIGVCVGVAGLILLAIVVFICCLFYRKDRKRRSNGYKERLVVDRYDRPPYPAYEKPVPEVIYDPPPLPPPPPPTPPPPPPVWRERFYRRPRSIEPIGYRYDSWDRRRDLPPRKYYSDNRWNGIYRSDPVVVSVAEPEYVSSGVMRREPDTIYLKYVTDEPRMRYSGDYETRYSDDMVLVPRRERYLEDVTYVPRGSRHYDDLALLPRTNYVRRYDYGNNGNLRRARSFNDMRHATAFVGDWGGRRDNLFDFNEHAMRAGRDPFLWK